MRLWLKVAVGVLAAIGGVLTVWVFASSLRPPNNAVADTDQVYNIGDLQAGEIRSISIKGRPHFIVRPNDEMLASIESLQGQVSDRGIPRSKNGDSTIFVFAAYGDGCLLKHVARGAEPLEPTWLGGFIDPCRGSRYDYAGRYIRSRRYIVNDRIADMPSLKVPSYILRDQQLEIRSLESGIRG
jgi:ubiquinol-cytochrome c reductase iron-sulfur subunit